MDKNDINVSKLPFKSDVAKILPKKNIFMFISVLPSCYSHFH